MNANELADELDEAVLKLVADNHFTEAQAVEEGQKVLRQQQAEIEQCKREIDELYECLKEAVNNHKVTHLHPFWIEYRKRKAQEK